MRTSPLLAVLLLSACQHASPRPVAEEPPLSVDVHVTGLGAEERARLETELCALPGVQGCERATRAGEAIYTLRYQGSLPALERQIAAIQHPGLEPVERKASLRFDGYDNLAPTLKVLSPEPGRALTETRVDVLLEVPDIDVASVQVGAVKARAERRGVYRARVKLDEGENPVTVVATDEAGNEARQTLLLLVDTTPPEVDAQVRVVVEGTAERGSIVLVDGAEVPVDLLGRWRAEVAVRRGQEHVEVTAIDENGNKKSEKRPIFVPGAPSTAQGGGA